MYRALFEALDEPIEIRRRSGALVARNAAAVRLDLPSAHGARCAAGAAPVRVDHAGRTWELAPLPLDTNLVAVRARDLTDLERIHASAEAVEQAKVDFERFSYLLSHDLQEPLRLVGMYAQLLERRASAGLDDLSRRHLDTVLANVQRMHRLIDDLLELSRVEREEIPGEPVDLQELIDELVAALPDRDAHVRWAGLPTVRGSRDLLRRAFQRLIDNAVTYRGEAPLEIALTARRTDDRWQITVADNGIGIDPAFHERIFQPFKRLHAWEAHPGTGIGLAICKRAIERHGGSISVDSAPGAGARFVVELPADAPPSRPTP